MEGIQSPVPGMKRRARRSLVEIEVMLDKLQRGARTKSLFKPRRVGRRRVRRLFGPLIGLSVGDGIAAGGDYLL